MSAIPRPQPEDCLPCRNCGQPIFDDYGRWLHRDDTFEQIEGLPFEVQSDYGMKGCRSASFRPGQGWDDSLDRNLNAAPPKREKA